MPHHTRQTMSKLNIRHMWFFILSRNCSFILFLALCPKQLGLCELDQLAHLSTDLKPMASPGRREHGRWKRHQGISSAAVSICWCILMTMAVTFHKYSLYQIPWTCTELLQPLNMLKDFTLFPCPFGPRMIQSSKY